MKVEIWSDVMCPFCYIGKHRFERALAQFTDKDKVQVEWKSFQLDSTLQGVVSKDEYFAKKGFSNEQFKAVSQNLKQMAAEENIVIDNEKTIISNTYKAHQLMQLAKAINSTADVEEVLFKMYFEEGFNMDQDETIYEAAKRLNIPADLVKDALENKTYEAAFETDLYEAQQFGISGVPFFIFDRKYAVSGAQPVEHFLGALNQAFTEWQNKQPQPLVNLSNPTGDSCDINGNC